MRFKIFGFIVCIALLFFMAIFIYPGFKRSPENGTNLEFKISTSTLNLFIPPRISTTSANNISENVIKIIKPKPKPISYVAPVAKPVVIKEVSPKSFEELINSSVIQLYCGYLGEGGTTLSGISRGTGIIIDEKGEILTNRHVVYDENSKKVRSDCFVLKSPFPDEKSENPKIYYAAEIMNYPTTPKFSDSFSKDNYYNDFAILKIVSKPDRESKINLLLGFDYASPEDYLVLESSTSLPGQADTFNFLPVDWNYQPKNNDNLITLGYGVDASHNANKITSTIGRLYGNVSIDGTLKPQILLIESNATAGFSGGALINPQSKGLVGLVSWITSGEETGKYTVAIFRDFLRTQLLQDLNFDLKQ